MVILLLKFLNLWEQFVDQANMITEQERHERDLKRDEALNHVKNSKTVEEALDAQRSVVINKP